MERLRRFVSRQPPILDVCPKSCALLRDKDVSNEAETDGDKLSGIDLLAA